jgi:hypothetical protein
MLCYINPTSHYLFHLPPTEEKKNISWNIVLRKWTRQHAKYPGKSYGVRVGEFTFYKSVPKAEINYLNALAWKFIAGPQAVIKPFVLFNFP